MRALPSALDAPKSARMVELDGTFYCLTASASGASIASASNIEGDWTSKSTTLPQGADINSLTAAPSGLYITDSSHRLHNSTDGGLTWTATGASMSHIYGAYGDEVIGCLRRADGSYVQISYPSATDPATATALPEGCPVEGTSALMVYSTEWSYELTAITTGGRSADGTPTGASWGYDGRRWMNVSLAPGAARSGMSVVAYTGYRNEGFWDVKPYEVFLAFGGMTADGKVSNEMWISFDRGLHWTQGRESIQLPEFIPALHGASAIVADQTLTSTMLSSRSRLWKDYPDAPLPSRASIDTSWTCPYIYIAGGYTASGALSPSIWRGAINRLTYRPLF